MENAGPHGAEQLAIDAELYEYHQAIMRGEVEVIEIPKELEDAE